jgi:hypothetical protein
MIRTLSDLLRLYGDRTVLSLTGDGRGNRTVITFEIDHPAECQMCLGEKCVPCSSWPGHSHVCDECSGSGLALDIGGES